MDAAEYCREIEAYLCRKNEGHLIRIVGPVFEQVSGWAARGVPLAIVFRGIDRFCERYYAKGPRRRPVRVEFCEADILDLFDDWRRAVGVSAADGGNEPPHETRKDSLPAHLDRIISRLTGLRAGKRSPAFDAKLDEVVRELDRTRASARAARGDARAALLDRLAALDRELLETAAGELDRQTGERLRREAEAEIAPFSGRMASDARDNAVRAAFERLVRDALGLPAISL